MRGGRWSWGRAIGVTLALGLLGAVVSLGAAKLIDLFPRSTTYVSNQGHFSVAYPAEWQCTILWTDATGQQLGQPCSSGHDPALAGPQVAGQVPLTFVITRSNATAANGSLVSNLTIAILDLHNPQALDPKLLHMVMTRATDKSYHAVMLAGRTAYATQPLNQPILGSQQTATHVDYYLLANSLEYHLSSDVLAGDQADAAIQGMLASFIVTN
jgi:hypothetical protein